MIGIHAHLRGQIKRNGKTRCALGQKIAVAPVAFLGRAESGILAHCPGPPAIHIWVNSPCVRVLARETVGVGHDLEILRAFQKDEIPYQAIKSTKMVPTSCKPRDSLPRMTRYPNTTANTMKTKPITSFHKTWIGRIILGIT